MMSTFYKRIGVSIIGTILMAMLFSMCVLADVNSYQEDTSVQKPTITRTYTYNDGTIDRYFYYNVTPEKKEYTLYVEFSNNSKFVQSEDGKSWVSYRIAEYSDSFASYYYPMYGFYGYDIEEGDTIYIRSFYYDSASLKRSPYSNVLSFQVKELYSYINKLVAKKSQVKLSIGGYYDYVEVYRKIEKGKFTLIDKTSDITFTDTGLAPGKKYTYKTVPYVYNYKLKKYVKGAESKASSVMTKGQKFNVKAICKSAGKVKLKWNKMSGVKYYEIYRYEGYSSGDIISNGISNDCYVFRKIAKVKKNKKAYIDKSVTPNSSYTYLIKAVYKDGCVIEEYVNTYTYFGSIEIENSYYTSTGTKCFEWRNVVGATGYKVDKKVYNKTKETWEWKNYKTLGKNTTSIRLSNDSNNYYTTYRIYAVSGSKMSSPWETSVYQVCISPKINAVSTANGIKLSWDKVPGAICYSVSVYDGAEFSYYNKNLNAYEDIRSRTSEGSVSQVTNIHKEDGDKYYSFDYDYSGTYKDPSYSDSSWYYGEKDRFTKTSVEWKSVQTGENEWFGPKPGKTYYFVVIAHFNKENPNTGDSYYYYSTYYKNIAKATYKKEANPKATVIKKIKKLKGKKVKLLLKQVKGCTYVIYRSTKKKSGYMRVGVTSKSSFKDSGLAKKKTYYYKVKVIKTSSTGEILSSGFSKVKKIKIKK